MDTNKEAAAQKQPQPPILIQKNSQENPSDTSSSSPSGSDGSGGGGGVAKTASKATQTPNRGLSLAGLQAATAAAAAAGGGTRPGRYGSSSSLLNYGYSTNPGSGSDAAASATYRRRLEALDLISAVGTPTTTTTTTTTGAQSPSSSTQQHQQQPAATFLPQYHHQSTGRYGPPPGQVPLPYHYYGAEYGGLYPNFYPPANGFGFTTTPPGYDRPPAAMMLPPQGMQLPPEYYWRGNENATAAAATMQSYYPPQAFSTNAAMAGIPGVGAGCSGGYGYGRRQLTTSNLETDIDFAMDLLRRQQQQRQATTSKASGVNAAAAAATAAGVAVPPTRQNSNYPTYYRRMVSDGRMAARTKRNRRGKHTGATGQQWVSEWPSYTGIGGYGPFQEDFYSFSDDLPEDDTLMPTNNTNSNNYGRDLHRDISQLSAMLEAQRLNNPTNNLHHNHHHQQSLPPQRLSHPTTNTTGSVLPETYSGWNPLDRQQPPITGGYNSLQTTTTTTNPWAQTLAPGITTSYPIQQQYQQQLQLQQQASATSAIPGKETGGSGGIKTGVVKTAGTTPVGCGYRIKSTKQRSGGGTAAGGTTSPGGGVGGKNGKQPPPPPVLGNGTKTTGVVTPEPCSPVDSSLASSSPTPPSSGKSLSSVDDTSKKNEPEKVSTAAPDAAVTAGAKL